MNHVLVAHYLKKFFAFAATFVFICTANAQIHKNYSYSKNSKGSPINRVDRLFDKKRIFCFGRFVMEVPENSNIVYGPVHADGDLIFYEGEAGNIGKIVADRLVEVETEKTYKPKYEIADMPLIGKVIDGIVPGQKIVFGASDSVGYSIDSYIPLGKDLFVHSSSSLGSGTDELPLVNRIATQLRLRSEQEIPTDQGICIERGFLATELEHENIAVGLNFKEFPDIRFSISMRKNQDYLPEGSSPKKLREKARASAERRGFGEFFANIKTLREGGKLVGVWEGEEILSRRPLFRDETDAHEFRFFGMGSTHDAFHPSVDIRLDTGVKGNATARVKPGISDKDAVALWDRLLSTIRLRLPSNVARESML